MTEDIDFEMFWKLSSLYQALTISATAPVVFPTGLGRGIFSHAFYDTFDNDGEVLEAMWARIRSSSNEIRDSFVLHCKMRDGFYSLEEAANAGNRKNFAHHTEQIYNRTVDYARIVQHHRGRLASKAFLAYPTCSAGHYFMIPGDERIREKKFNPNQRGTGLMDEINAMRTLHPEFYTITYHYLM